MGAPARIHAAGERVSLLPESSASASASAEAEAEARARASPLRRVPARAAAASALALLALAGCAAAGPDARSAALAALGGPPPAPRRNAVHRAIFPRGRDDPPRAAATRATRRAVVPRLGGAPDPADSADDSADNSADDSADASSSSSSSPDADRPTLGLAERFRRAATASGFVLPVTADERAAHAWLADDDSDASDSAAEASSSSPRSSSSDPKDLLLENILGGGADAIPDVIPGIPFDVRDAAYDEPGWFHRPIARRSETRRNAFTFCVDSADEWDLAFPEGWFQNWRFGVNGGDDGNDSSDSSSSSSSTPGYCVESVTYARNGTSCGDADVVLFNEGALIWHGRHRTDDDAERDPTRPAYLLPPKAHPDQTYVYFAHEAPAGFGSELLDPSVMSQFDYLASANRAASSLWWSFVPSARHLTQDFDAFRRPLANRAPVLAWLAIDCGGKAREGILGEIARHFPVWSVGSCRNNKPSDPDLPGRDASSDAQRRRMQMSLSKYLFYFAAENAECPGYTTEKLWLALSRGSVPVYFGDGEVKAHLPCDECVLDVRDFPDAQSLAARMRAIATTPGEYERITAWRRGDPKAWPEAFREALATASADVARVTCGVLREGTRAYRKAEAQGQQGGGGEVGGVARLAAAKRAACPANDDAGPEGAAARGDGGDEIVEGGSSSGSSSSGALGGGGARSGPRPVFGRRVRAFESGGADGGAFVAPETHYERPCDDDERAECFRFRASS